MGAVQQMLIAEAASASVTYATWNPSDKGANITLSGSNLVATTTGSTVESVRATIGKSSGKWYWEISCTGISSNTAMIGVANSSLPVATSYTGQTADGWGYYSNDGNKYHSGGGTPYGASYTNGDVIGVALDMNAGTLILYKNNTSQGTAYTGLSGTLYPCVSAMSTVSSVVYTANFGATSLTYSPPSGYNAGLYV